MKVQLLEVLPTPLSFGYGLIAAVPFGGIPLLAGGIMAAAPVSLGSIAELAINVLRSRGKISPQSAILLKNAIWLSLIVTTFVVASIVFSPLFGFFITLPVLAMAFLSMAKEASRNSPKSARLHG